MKLPEGFTAITIADILGIVVNVLTLLLAYRIYRSFDVKKTYVNRQLETVLLLIEEMNKTILSVIFHSKIPAHIYEKMPVIDDQIPSTHTWLGLHYSIFIIGGLSNENGKYGNVFVTTNVRDVLPFLSYINNPLLPTSIAQKLALFYSPFTNFGSARTATDNFVTIGNLKAPKRETDGVYEYPDFVDAFKSWSEFIRCSKELRIEIETWLKKHGAKDINFNFTLQYPVS